MRFIWPIFVAALAFGGPAEAACSQAQDQQAAQAVALSAARSQLNSVKALYSLMYSDVSYSVKVASASIKGRSATVQGHIILRGRDRQTGRFASGTYPGTVFLKRTSACTWQMTGYQRN